MIQLYSNVDDRGVCHKDFFLYLSLRRELFEDFMSYTNKYLQTENKIPQKLRNFSLVESFESCLLFIQFNMGIYGSYKDHKFS